MHYTPAERQRQRRIVLEALHYHPDTSDTRRAALRAWQALELATTPESWSQLLQGNTVPTDQLDIHALRRLRMRRVK